MTPTLTPSEACVEIYTALDANKPPIELCGFEYALGCGSTLCAVRSEDATLFVVADGVWVEV